jgi:hypothetical protein
VKSQNSKYSWTVRSRERCEKYTQIWGKVFLKETKVEVAISLEPEVAKLVLTIDVAKHWRAE